jgi:Bacterial Ig-like domain (DUF1927).
MSAQNTPPFPLRPLCLEYRVTGSLDGSTPAPAFAIPPSPASPVVAPENKVVQTVENLGLVDLTGFLGSHGQIADRLVKWILIYGPFLPTSANNIQVAFDGRAEPQTAITIPAGANGLYSRNCIFVPQSGQLMLDGMSASAGEPIIVRMQIWQPQTLNDLADMINACCCLASSLDEFGEPAFTTALYFSGRCTRTLISVIPNSVAQGAGPTALTVTGSGFTEGDIVRFIHSNGTTEIEVTQVVVNNSNSMTVTVDVAADQLQGTYDLTVAAPLAPQCSATLVDALTVT